MFYKKTCFTFANTSSKLWHKSTRSYRKFTYFNSTNIHSFPYTKTLVASAAAFGITLYILHKNKISCKVNLNPVIDVKIKDEKFYEEAIQKSRDILQRVKDENGIPGLVIGVSIDGKTIWKEGFGYADVENRVLCSPDTVMRIASISKSITMTAVAKLWEQGKLDLDKPVQEYVPTFPQKTYDGKKVTITCRQLVSHLGGIRHYYEEKNDPKKTNGKNNNNSEKVKEEMDLKEYYMTIKHTSLQSALDMFKNDPLIENPGTKFLYSTHGWTLVSAIVEAVSKEQFTVHISKLFKALGLKNTYLDENDILIYNRSRNYMKNKKGILINAPYVDNSYKWAGGGFLSTVGDLLQFANAMLYSFQARDLNMCTNVNNSATKEISNKKYKDDCNNNNNNNSSNSVNQKQLPGFLNSKTIEAMWEPIPPATNYGMGWGVHLQKQECQFCSESKFCVYHTGGAVGASSVLLIVPNESNENSYSSSESASLPKGIIHMWVF
ncbi:serine beta-lactamase-like protein LACTB, mitochondrial [Caerostris darwini]|uniref:Serine beta-lactamase-like protein LACTB, mitochondrial n=1 Tax=Caerostris darwini TaxID=1538125 RepID=A0AAV4UKA6_9ARAC|nr:serine beta-lactamase-like protein LACTB, mitochondrial [Caerostris darwini]